MGCGCCKSSGRDVARQLAEDGAQVDDPNGNDPLLDRELNGIRINKEGKVTDMYARPDNRPDENADFGMFQVEEAGKGDQALAVKPWLGQFEVPDNPPQVIMDEPIMNLELEYVYGYRCFDTRQNIFYSSNANEIVYHAAALGITLNTTVNTQKFMGSGDSKKANGHTDDITALCIHPDKEHIATGEVGKDPKVIVWNTKTMQPVKLFRNGRGSRGVTALAFSKDGNYLASCANDNDHNVRVWDWKSGSKVHEDKGGPDKILDANFNPTEDTLLTVGIKHIYFWNGANGWDKKKGIFGKAGKMCTQTSCGFLSNGLAVTGGSNGSIYLWNDNVCTKSVDIHNGFAASHTLRVDNDMIYTGGNDKCLHVLDANLQKKNTHNLPDTPRAVDVKGTNIIVGCYNGDIIEITGTDQNKVMESHCDGEVWGLDINNNSGNFITTAGDDNVVRTWNIAQRKCIASSVLAETPGAERKSGYGASTLAATTPNMQVRCVAVNDLTGEVALGFNDGSWEIRAAQDDLDNKVHKGFDCKDWIEAMHFSPNGQWLAIGSHDQTIYIIKTSDWSLVSKQLQHSSYITALDWSNDSKALKSTCGAYELLYWNIDEAGQITHNPNGRSELKNEEWATYTTHFGWPVQGIFRGVTDKTHINRVDTCNYKRFCVVGNDWGSIELFWFPNDESSKSKAYRGHSDHVVNVKFGDTHVFSAGGYDQCIMQWRRG